MSDKKIELPDEVMETFYLLKALEDPELGISISELIEITKIGVLVEIEKRLGNLDQTLIESGIAALSSVDFAKFSAIADRYVSERIETDKVVIGLLHNINKEMSDIEPPDEDYSVEDESEDDPGPLVDIGVEQG